ncbi:MAG TPA: hypothetical protein VLD39_13370, partial [Gammaproteobacteria bacterium]|nr:hypothetical protein [Gammaproteobacteria bacterium]
MTLRIDLIRITAVWLAVLAPSAYAQAPRTPWGVPDLQGIWSNPYETPLERPERFGTRAFLTDEEIAEAEQALIVRYGRPGRDSREGTGTERDVARAYNEHWRGDPTYARGRRTSMIVDPEDGRMPALTPAAQARIAEKTEFLDALLQGTSGGRPGPISPRRIERSPDYNLDRINRADGPEDRSATERCLGYGLPLLLPAGTLGGVAQIVQSPDTVAIYYDSGQGQGFSRIIPITDRPHVPQHIRLRHGDARGRWEGDALVVDITNFTQKTSFFGSRENLHLVERYRRLDAETLSYEVTIDDPTTFTRPWTVAQELTINDAYANQVYEGGCHEGNFGLLGMLINTRAAERAFAENRGTDPATQDNATGGG